MTKSFIKLMSKITLLSYYSFIGIGNIWGISSYIYALGEIENIVAGDEVERLQGQEIYEWAGDGLHLAWAMEDSKVEAMVTRLVI